MPQVGFEPMIPVFERAKTFRALDFAATHLPKKRTLRRLYLQENNSTHTRSPKAIRRFSQKPLGQFLSHVNHLYWQ
jgi:hypothetical protein